jgi:ubiquinone/menaquinone biosynthesis C-methylase UbiE
MAMLRGKNYHEGMRSALPPERQDRNLEARLVSHYSRITDWLDSRTWYIDDEVSNVVRFLISSRPNRVLELCCGSGILLERLSDAFPEAEFIGIDISTNMVERARERLSRKKNVLVLQRDWIYGLPSALNKTFNVIIVKNALHLLNDLPSKLRDLRLLSGEWTNLIVVETVSPNSDANRFIKRLFEIVDREHLKQSLFTESTLTAVLEEAGWIMAQERPWHVRQHIDTDDWLSQRCSNQAAVAAAKNLLASVNNVRVRRAMDFFSAPGTVPAQMLRLQYIARHVFVPERLQTEKRRDGDRQLQLT